MNTGLFEDKRDFTFTWSLLKQQNIQFSSNDQSDTVVGSRSIKKTKHRFYHQNIQNVHFSINYQLFKGVQGTYPLYCLNELKEQCLKILVKYHIQVILSVVHTLKVSLTNACSTVCSGFIQVFERNCTEQGSQI